MNHTQQMVSEQRRFLLVQLVVFAIAGALVGLFVALATYAFDDIHDVANTATDQPKSDG